MKETSCRSHTNSLLCTGWYIIGNEFLYLELSVARSVDPNEPKIRTLTNREMKNEWNNKKM